MSSEESLIAVRKEKHQQLNGGIYPTASSEQLRTNINLLLIDINALITAAEIKTTVVLDEAMGNGTKMLRGRISALRKSGAITFIKFTDVTGNIQLVATKNNLVDYEKLKLLDLGDIVEVVGEPILTKTAEKSLLISAWKVLTKSHRAPPEKFVGIQDQELKYRKRYLDLMSSEESRARFIVRTYVIRAIRSFMDTRSFLEVETSTLNTIASGANAKPFSTHHNALDIELRLRIAPELNLKRLLVGGLERVYEIGRNYRNEGIDTKHNPEFTMMESYEAYGKFHSLIVSTKAMLSYVDRYLGDYLPANTLIFYKKWLAERPFSSSQCVEVTMTNAVLKGLDKANLIFDTTGMYTVPGGETPAITNVQVGDPNNERLQKIDVKGMFHALSNCDSIGEQIAVLFEFVAEPFLTEDYRSDDGKHSCPVFITEYPKEISPLARESDIKPGITDRFELFVEGCELANAFQELNDPDDQALRFKEQLESNNKDPMDYDADYVEALEYGLPPCIGLGIGIDRLCMLLTNTSSIKDVILFPTLKPLK